MTTDELVQRIDERTERMDRNLDRIAEAVYGGDGGAGLIERTSRLEGQLDGKRFDWSKVGVVAAMLAVVVSVVVACAAAAGC